MWRGVLTALALTTTVAFAQPTHKGHGEHKGPRAETRKALKTYVESNVLPVVAPLREAFDQNLSAVEQQELADIRQGLQELKEARKADFQKSSQHHTPGERPEMTEEQRAAMQQAAKTKRQLMTRAWAIADAHESELNEVFETLRPEAQNWRQEMRKIAEANRPEGKPGHEGKRSHHGEKSGAKGEHRRPHKGGMRRGGGGQLRQLQTPVGFLLWEPGVNLFEEAETPTTLQAFPNPTSNTFTLKLEATKPGTVKVSLVSEMGEPIKTLYTGKTMAGTQELSLDLSGVEAGAYILHVQGPDGPQAIKIIKE